MSILLTGAAGYIGSHVALELLKLDYNIIIVDNCSHSSGDNVYNLIKEYPNKVIFFDIDIRDKEGLEKIFKEYVIETVIHFAGLKSVRESFQDSLNYYYNNVGGTLTLLEVMKKYLCHNLIFSSSATVYGISEKVPIDESCPIQPINPYGQTKAMIDQILSDLSAPWKIVSLRYFNPVGLDKSGILQEETEGEPENLFPYIIKVLKGELEKLTVFGYDYPTSDGTPIRDYIHINDLAGAHISALQYLPYSEEGDIKFVNIGTGKGYSVLEVIKCFEEIGHRVKYLLGPRRQGDAAESYADATYAEKLLKWKSKKNLTDMCQDSILNLD